MFVRKTKLVYYTSFYLQKSSGIYISPKFKVNELKTTIFITKHTAGLQNYEIMGNKDGGRTNSIFFCASITTRRRPRVQRYYYYYYYYLYLSQ